MCMYVVSVSINDQWIIYFLCTLTKGHRRSRTRKYSNLLFIFNYVYLSMAIYLSPNYLSTIYVSMYLCIYICIYLCMHVPLAYLCVYTFLPLHSHFVCMQVCVYARMCVCMYVCMYVCKCATITTTTTTSRQPTSYILQQIVHTIKQLIVLCNLSVLGGYVQLYIWFDVRAN